MFKHETKEELKDLILKVKLSEIDTSLITDMSEMFAYSRFNRGIPNWNISKVENM